MKKLKIHKSYQIEKNLDHHWTIHKLFKRPLKYLKQCISILRQEHNQRLCETKVEKAKLYYEPSLVISLTKSCIELQKILF